MVGWSIMRVNRHVGIYGREEGKKMAVAKRMGKAPQAIKAGPVRPVMPMMKPQKVRPAVPMAKPMMAAKAMKKRK